MAYPTSGWSLTTSRWLPRLPTRCVYSLPVRAPCSINQAKEVSDSPAVVLLGKLSCPKTHTLCTTFWVKPYKMKIVLK